MIKQRKIELLAPAKNLECGIEAVNHGADAVYIGAPKFGARAAAVNSLPLWWSMPICIMSVSM